MSIDTLLSRAQRTYRRHFAECANGLDLTARQADLLQEIANSDGATQAYLAHATGIDTSTLSVMVQGFVERDVAVNVYSPDSQRHTVRRVVRITPTGKRLLKRAVQVSRQADIRFMAGMSGADITRLQMILERAGDDKTGR